MSLDAATSTDRPASSARASLPSPAGLRIAPEVAQALAEGRAVVALESTIVAHGMPWPRNLETARRVEAEVRAQGAVPATVAVVAGRPCVGLEAAELEALAREGPRWLKLSRRDLAHAVAGGHSGATTVATTMLLAARAGIALFATGGIGGVHRGAAQSFDISADLQELARTPVTVVCAGAKSILDLGLTLEYLETQGVPVVGYGTDRLPAFFVRESPHALALRVDSPGQAAALVRAQRALGLEQGIVLANPIDAAHALPADRMEALIAQALDEAALAGVAGKAITPYLLARVNALSGGDSLAANVELVAGNARLAARVAVELARQTG
jgi:pseudouridine-5'-phosphate glycosidase